MGPSRKIGWYLSLLVALLATVSSSVGLWVSGIYVDSSDVASALRGADFVTLFFAVPLLLAGLWLARRRSVRGNTVWVAMLGYSVYAYAFQVFGPTFNDLFVVHVATFVLSMTALGFAVAGSASTAIALRWDSVVLDRIVAVALFVLIGFMVFSYSIAAIRYATGGPLPEDVVPLPEWRVHLGYVLDLTLIVPPSLLGAILMWRRHPWGYGIVTAVFVFLAVFQIAFLSIAVFMDDAGVVGASDAIPQAISAFVVFGVPAVLLLIGIVDDSVERT